MKQLFEAASRLPRSQQQKFAAEQEKVIKALLEGMILKHEAA